MEKTDSTVERIGGYRIVRRLAIGGTSDVLLAKAEGPLGFERAVVLKRLLAQYKSDDDFTKMFAREAAAYARLSHPAIVRLFDFFATSTSVTDRAERAAPSADSGDAQLVMVLEYVDGPPLHRLRGMLKAMGGALDDVASIHVAAAIFDALAAAHAANDESGAPAPVIHRDVNPTNVLIGWDGQVKLADFGVAKVTGVTHESRAGLVRGTYGYMAPEQVTGAPVTPRADVYAAGIVLWEMLTKRRAFQRGALPEVEVMRSMAEPRLVTLDALRPDIDKTVREAVSRALVPNAQKRTITAEEMVAVLRAAVHPDKGRERLLAALGVVRHEPKISATSMPPPPPPGEADALHPSSQAMAAPRVPRAAATGVKAPRPSGTQSAAGAAPKPSPYRQTSSAAVVSPLGGGTLQASPAPPAAPAVTTSTAPGGTGSLAPVGLFDSLVVPPVKNADSPVLKLDTPFSDLKPGPALRDQIDDLLKDVPTTVPPHLFGERTAAQRTREIGHIPAAPPPLRTSSEQRMAAVNVSGAPPLPVAAAPLAQASKEAVATKQESVATAKGPPAPPPPLPSVQAANPPAAIAPPPPPLPAPEPASVNPSDVLSLSDDALRDSVPPFRPDRPTSIPPSRRRRRGPLLLVLSGMFLCTSSFAAVGAMKYVRARRAQAPITPPTLIATTPPTSPTPTVSPFVATTASASPIGEASASSSAIAVAPAASEAPSASVVALAMPSANAEPPAPVAKNAAKPSTPTPSAGTGIVKTEGAAPGRRIFIDERTVGQTPQPITVKCGMHMIKVGSSGRARSVDVPCGGEVTVSDR